MTQLSHIPVPIPLLNLMSMLRSQLSLMSMLRSLLSLMLMSRFQLSHTSTLSQLLLMLPPLLMPDMLLPLLMPDMLLALLTPDMPLPQLLLDMLESQLLLDMPVSQLSLDMLVSPLLLDMLWDTPGCWWNACQLELSQHLVVLGHFSLALVYLQFYLSLAVSCCGEHLGLLGRNGCVSVDQLSENSSQSLNTKGKRSHIKKQNVSDISSKHTSLDSSSHCNSFIRVNRFAWCTTKHLLASVLNLGHPGHASDQKNFPGIRFGDFSILHGFHARFDSLFDEVTNNLLKLSPGQLHIHVFRTRGVHGEVGQVNISLSGGRELDLGLLSSFPDPLQGHGVLGKINPLFLLELINQMTKERIVEVFSTQEGVAIG